MQIIRVLSSWLGFELFVSDIIAVPNAKSKTYMARYHSRSFCNLGELAL